MAQKLRAFIGSSSENLRLAMAAEVRLQKDLDVTLWEAGVFNLTKDAIDSLLLKLSHSDVGIFILAADDVAVIRGQSQKVPRDNVIFELGLFMGRLGRDRTFFIVPANAGLHLPTDLLGVTPATYDPARTGPGELEAAISPACSKILLELEKRPATPKPPSGVTLGAFLKEIPLPDIKAISVSAYTGSSTVKRVCKYIEDHAAPGRRSKITLTVLLHAKELSDRKRANDTKASEETLKALALKYPWLDIRIHYYTSPPLLRSVIIDHRSAKAPSAFLGYYDWQNPEQPTRRPTGNDRATFIVEKDPDNPQLCVHRSWFSHLAGVGRIHALVFDFDDTLFFTAQARADAWADAIQHAIKEGWLRNSDLTPEAARVKNFSAHVLAVLLQEQDEAKVAERLLKRRLSDLTSLADDRHDRRKRYTLERAEPIGRVLTQLEKLKNTYKLIIVTATESTLVEEVLRRHKISMFSNVFGRDGDLDQWEDFSQKSHNLVKVSTLMGVPLNRMIYFGDSTEDLRSATRLRMPFVENAIVARERFKRDSLIEINGPRNHPVITGKSDDELAKIVARIEEAREG